MGVLRRGIPALACLALAVSLTAAAADTTRPLDRTVTLDLWGAGLEEAARDIFSQTGVRVLFYRPELPGLGMADRVYLVTGRVPLRTVMECLAWRFSFRYRVAADGRVEVSRGYGWATGEPKLGIYRLEALTPRQDCGPAEMRAFLAELVKPTPLMDGDFSVAVERYPTPSHAGGLRATAVLPPVLADYLARAVACLEGTPGDYPPAARERSLFASAWNGPGAGWETLLGKRVDGMRGGTVREALAAVARAAGVAFVFRGSPEGVDGAVDLGTMGLGAATEELARRYGLGKRVFLACGAVGFEGAGAGAETDSRGREIFWDGLAVAGFDARSAAERVGGGAALCARIRREVHPWLWRDAVCGLRYSETTGRLVVIAPENVLEAVAGRLRGPVEP